jgi:diguanylate cyclase (GGDEF)-like protein/PAS domain S-box-containing protein
VSQSDRPRDDEPDWHAILSALGQAVIVTDLAGVIRFWNAAAERLYGWSSAEALGRTITDLTVPRPQRQQADEILQTLQAGQPWSGRFTVRRRDGSTFPALVTDTGVHDAAGRLVGIVGISHDLSEQQAAEDRLTANQAWWQAVVSHSADVAVVANAQNEITYVASAAQRLFGWSPERVRDRIGLDLVHPEDRMPVAEALAEVMSDPDAHPVVEFRLKHRDGTWHWVEETISNLLGHPDVRGVVGNLRDVTDRRTAVDRLRKSEALYRAIVETAQEGILVVDAEERVTFANGRLADFFGVPAAALIGRSATGLLPDDDEVAARLRHRQDATGERFEIPFRRRDGEVRHLLVSANALYDDAGEHLGSLSMYADITERKQTEEALLRSAMIDPLTGLANRVLLKDRLDAALARARREGGKVGLLFIDLDQFKSVNDGLGHGVGDELLLLAAERIGAAVRAHDTVARFGGDEFVVLADGLKSVVEATALAERVRSVFRQPLHVAGLDLVITASIGVSIASPDVVSRARDRGDRTAGDAASTHLGTELLRQADIALYQAKAKGRACWELYEPETSDRTDQLLLVGELRNAAENEQLRLHYQPIVELATGRVVGVEALLRWQHPVRGLLDPAVFIPLAEQTGLIVELDRWAMTEATAQAAAWHQAAPDTPPVTIAVNLSALHLADRHLPARIEAILRSTGLDPSTLKLEVTETGLMNDPDAALGVLHALKALGVRLAIDDFGTGYSSLTYLKRFPVDELKIDRSFVAGLGTDHEDTAIVASVLGLASAVGVEVVAEGVETEDQRRVLEDLGCPLAQGYLWSRPQPATTVRLTPDPALLPDPRRGR